MADGTRYEFPRTAMSDHYENAVAGLAAMDDANSGTGETSEATANAVVLIQATLATAKATEDLLKAQETANLIAYAQLRRDRRRPSLAAEQLVDGLMSRIPEIKEELDEDGED